MDLRIFTEPQLGASYDQQLRLARAAEDAGFDAYFRSDHLLTFSGDGLPGPTDTWITLAGLARETTRIRLGTLVTSATFRHPGMLALAVTQVDVMSGGRVELGLGAGWFDREHEAFGIPFPSMKERFERLEEQLAILRGLWATPSGSDFTHSGRHYSIEANPALPRPAQNPPPLIVGGLGPKTTPRLAATYANEFNVPFAPLDDVRSINSRVDDACATAGRDPKTLLRSVALTVCCGRDEAELKRRAAATGQPLENLRKNQLAGTPSELVERLGAFAELGLTRAYLQVLDFDDLDQIDLIASEVLPQLA
jgi:F420-dependent oxidoreductase-like protein